jgi:hypothetical protein
MVYNLGTTNKKRRTATLLLMVMEEEDSDDNPGWDGYNFSFLKAFSNNFIQMKTS